ncbi:MAG TPA: DUF2785 domain-containing protein [Trebonia sp.]|nr:DUF2785 domain-containing protein [Trebonia sp.]
MSGYSQYSRANLLEMLRSPDPAERDDIAYLGMVQRVGSGAEDDDLIALGDEMAARLTDGEIQTRTFGALILGNVVERDQATGLASRDAVLRWRDAFAGWYAAERDLRGWDEGLGWLHAVAHGADTLATFGRSARLDRDDLRGLLDLGCARMLAPTEFVLRDQEDDRLGYALALVLARAELAADDSVGWLRPVCAAFAAGGPGPVPAFATNTMRTLRVLYLLCDRGFLLPEATQGEAAARSSVAHPAALKPALAEALRYAWPYVA